MRAKKSGLVSTPIDQIVPGMRIVLGRLAHEVKDVSFNLDLKKYEVKYLGNMPWAQYVLRVKLGGSVLIETM